MRKPLLNLTLACVATATLCHGNVLSDENRLRWMPETPVFLHACLPGKQNAGESIGMDIQAGSHHGGRANVTLVGDGHFVVTASNGGWMITNNQTHAWNATVDGPVELFAWCITPGNAQLRLAYTNTNASGVSYRSSIRLRGLPPLSKAPRSSKAYVWDSLQGNLPEFDGRFFETALTNQGFNVTWFRAPVDFATGGFGTCTLANYKKLANAGAINIISHGNVGVHEAVRAPLTPAGLNACNAWHGGSEQGMTTVSNVVIRGGVIVENESYYCVLVDTTWLANNWKPTWDENQTIVMWSSCFSASNCPTAGISVKEAAGGRWRTGYKLQVNRHEANDVNQEFLERMNGKKGNGNFRNAGSAYNDFFNTYMSTYIYYEYDDNFDGIVDRNIGSAKMDGEPWTTLCPAPLAVNPAYPLAPVTAKRRGWGGVLFDTALDPQFSSVLTKVSGGASISDGQVLKDPEGNLFGFGFVFDKTSNNSTTTMRAFSDKIRNESNEGEVGRQMDGNRVQPNNDDFDWSF